MAPSGDTDEQDGVMATRPATTPDAAPRLVGRPSRIRARDTVGRGGRSGVEAEPAEPQQPGAEHHEGQVVRAHGLAWPAPTLAEYQCEREARGTGVDVHRGPTCEVDRRKPVRDPAADRGGNPVEREHPVRDREVDDRRPECGEDQPRHEPHAISDGTRDQGDGDDREHRLEGDEHRGREGADQRNGHLRAIAGQICPTEEALETEELRWVAE
jgi:hypothetical protein